MLASMLGALRRGVEEGEAGEEAARGALRQLLGLRGHALAESLLDDEGAAALLWLSRRLLGDAASAQGSAT